MKGFTDSQINEFLNQFDYDVRKSHDARWIDQKCTMDVVSLIADCILRFVSIDKSKEFTVNDIWHSPYTVENVQQIFAKPNPNEKADNEYDKYFGQPIKLLGYSRILNCDFEDFDNNLKRLISFIDNEIIIKDYIDNCIENGKKYNIEQEVK